MATETLEKENPTRGRWPIWLSLGKGNYGVGERTAGRVKPVASFLARARRG